MATTISDPYNIGDCGGAFSAGSGNAVMPRNYSSEGIDALINDIASPTGFGQIAGGLGNIFGGLMGAGQSVLNSPDALMGLAGGLLTKESYDRLSDIGSQAKQEAMGLAERGQRESQFRPFTVTTPTGAMFTSRMGGQPTTPSFGQPSGPVLTNFEPLTDGLRPRVSSPYDGMGDELRSRLGLAPGEPLPTGPYVERTSYMPPELPQPTTGGLEVGMTLSPQEQAMQQQLLGGAGDFFGQAQMPTAAREQAIFDRMRATQRPEEERQRLATEERLASQGRLGLRTAQFGGAPEQFALAKAQEESRNEAMLSAMQQAQQEQMQQAQLGGQFMGAGYTPQAQALNVLQAGLPAAQMAQRGQLYGAGLFGEAEMGGLEALLGSGLGQANLYGQLGTGLLSGLLTPQSVGMGGGVTEIVNPFFELLGIGG